MKKYIFLSILLVIIFSFDAVIVYLYINVANIAKKRAPLINILGRQRMYSQRIAILNTIENECNIDKSLKINLIKRFIDINASLVKSEYVYITSEIYINSINNLANKCEIYNNATMFLEEMELYITNWLKNNDNDIAKAKKIFYIVGVFLILLQGIIVIIFFLLFYKVQKKNIIKEKNFINFLFHEIRNSLNHIINGIEFIQDDHKKIITNQMQNDLEVCLSGCELIKKILNETLYLSRLESIKYIDNNSVVNVNELCYKCIKIVQGTLLKKNNNIIFNSTVSDEFCYLLNEICLTQVLINIITNAIVYSNINGVITLDISVIKADNFHDKIIFNIIDNGIGISKKNQKELFKKFKIFSNSSCTGLGLYISYLMIKNMRGELKIESPYKNDNGSCFSFSLILKKTNKKPIIENTVSKTKIKNLNILICDDQNTNCIALKRKIEKMNLDWKVTITLNLDECLNQSFIIDYDIIILDEHYMNFKFTGSEYISKFKENSKILISSANNADDDIILYKKRGALDVIEKPIPSSDILYDKIFSAYINSN